MKPVNIKSVSVSSIVKQDQVKLIYCLQISSSVKVSEKDPEKMASTDQNSLAKLNTPNIAHATV